MTLIAFLAIAAPSVAADAIDWHSHWGDELFAQAKREHRLVILDLHAVWCHWCHVMDSVTYGDAQIQRLISRHYVAVRVDADSDPDLTSRYGDWGWPATIVLAPDGSEIVKRRGYIPPAQMASLLDAIIADPSPGPSVIPAVAVAARGEATLDPSVRAALTRTYEDIYDKTHGGWGDVHKLIDAAALELAFSKVGDDDDALRRARQTLDANLQLIDPVWGGVYQYSDAVDWRSPHFEKLMSYQADDLRLYSEAYERWHDPRYLGAAKALYDYITNFLTAPDGGFYASQDADVSAGLSGHDYYPRSDLERRKLGIPQVDAHEYARETGWAIRALCKYYDATGEAPALAAAERAAQWAITQRSLPVRAFRHGQSDRGGPFLDDQLSMSQAFLALYRTTGERRWLARTGELLKITGAILRDPRAGYLAATAAKTGRGVFREPVRSPEQNAALARVANLVFFYTNDPAYRRMARHSMTFLAAFARAQPGQFRPEILLADRELAVAPIHITVVGHKNDRAAQDLHAAALRYPNDYLQIDWWDSKEGALPNAQIRYPELARAAAFACTGTACSMPVFDAAGIEPAVRAALAEL